MAIKFIAGVTAAVALGVGATFAWTAAQDEGREGSQFAASTAQPQIASARTLQQAEDGAMTATQADEAAAKAAEEAAAAKPEPFVIKRILPIEGPIKYGEWYWDDEGVPDGPLVMTVDKQARVISVFRGGYEIGAAAVLLGTPDYPTPVGTFPILTKEKDNVSEKYDNAPMPYTLRLTWDGIAIHGSQVENGYASHGCVGTPTPFAEKLFAIAKKGDKVVITDGQRIGIGDALLGG